MGKNQQRNRRRGPGGDVGCPGRFRHTGFRCAGFRRGRSLRSRLQVDLVGNLGRPAFHPGVEIGEGARRVDESPTKLVVAALWGEPLRAGGGRDQTGLSRLLEGGRT